MTPRAWLPPGCLADDAVAKPMREVLAGWCEAWLGLPHLLGLSVVQAGRPLWTASLGEYRWEVHRGEVAIAAAPAAATRLRSRALDAGSDSRATGERDRKVLHAFDRRLFADLAARIEEAFAIRGEKLAVPELIEDPWSQGDTVAAVAAFTDGTEALRLAIPAAALVAFRRRTARAVAEDAPLVPLTTALRSVRVPIALRFGAAQLDLEELRGVSRGDVLVLDRALDVPADLLLSGQCFARAHVAEADGGIALSLQCRNPS